MNRRDLEKKLSPVTAHLFQTKGYICLVDVFVGLGYLTEKDVENWRLKKVPYLEKSIGVDLSKISFICKVVHSNCKNGNLRESKTELCPGEKEANKNYNSRKLAVGKLKKRIQLTT